MIVGVDKERSFFAVLSVRHPALLSNQRFCTNPNGPTYVALSCERYFFHAIFFDISNIRYFMPKRMIYFYRIWGTTKTVVNPCIYCLCTYNTQLSRAFEVIVSNLIWQNIMKKVWLNWRHLIAPENRVLSSIVTLV